MMTISELGLPKTSTTSGWETSDSSALILSNGVKPRKKRRLLIPQDMRKSESLKSKMPLPHLIKRQLKREGIKRMPSPHTSSERDEKQQSLSSVKKAECDLCSLDMRKDKERREKSDKKEALENEEGNGSGKTDCEDAGLVLKKKRLDACTYRAFLKHQAKNAKQSGASTSQADYGSQQLQGLPTNMDDLNTSPLPLITLNSSEVPEVQMTKSEGSSKVCCEQKSLYLLLKPAMSRLCDTLELPEDVRDMVGNFLDYIMYNDDYTCYIKKGLMYNDHVNQESETMLQAFQISLCWMTASFLRHKLDRKRSLMLAKQHLNFECKQEEAESIYSKLRVLKKCFSHRTGALRNVLSQGGQSSEQRSDHVTRQQTQLRTSKSSSSNELDLEGQRTLRSSSSNEQEGQIRSMRSTSLNQQEPGERRKNSLPNASVKPVPVEQDQASDDKTTIMLLPHRYENLSPNTESFNKDCRELVEVCTRRRREIHLRQQEEIREFINFWKKEREKLKKDQRLESEFVSIIHDNPAIRSDKLKKMDEHFVRKLNEISMFKESIGNFFLAKQQHARNQEKRIQASRLETAESGILSKSFADRPLSYSDLKLKSILTSEWSRVCSSLENVVLMSLSSSEPEKANAATPEILDKHCGTHDNDHLLQNLESVNLTILDGICAEAQEVVSNAELEGINRECLTSAVHPIVVNEVSGEGVEEGATLESGVDARVDKHSGAHLRDVSHSMSTQHQSLINIPPGHPSISPGQVNSISPHQLTSEQNQLTLSVEDEGEHISCRRQDFPLQTEIALQPVDVASLQIEQSNDIPISRPNDQLQLHPSTDSLNVEPAMPFKLPPSTVGLSSECNQLDTCAITQSESEPRSEWCSSFLQTEVLTRQPMEATTSQVVQCVHLVSESSMQLLMPSFANIPFRGFHMEDPQETRLLLESMQTSPMISHRLPLPSLDPLNNELAKLHSKKEECFKMHEDVKLRLATERDKEIEEVRRKYNKFIHDSEVLLMEQKKKLELIMDKVHLNKVLAEVVKPGFPHAKLGGQPSKPGMLSTLTQQFPMQSLQQNAQRPLRPPACPVQVAHGCRNEGMFSTLTQQFPMQSLQQNAPRPPRPPARPVQVVHHPSELFSSKAPMPHSSPIIPQHANHRINSDSRVLPLHHPLGLTSTSARGDSLIRGMSCQISPTHASTMQPLPSQFWPHIPRTMEASNGNQLRVHSSSSPSIHNSFPSAPELLMNLHNWSGTDRLQF